MGILHVSIVILAVVLDAIELSLQSEDLRIGAPIPGISRTRNSSSPDRNHSPERSRSRSPSSGFHSGRASSPDRSPYAKPPPVGPSGSRPPTSARFMVPPTMLPSYHKKGQGLEHLESIRITSRTKPSLIFELRRYTFPTDKSITVRLGNNVYEPLPSQEQIVMSTSDGDVFAILESMDRLAGIYVYDSSTHYPRRVKINVRSGIVIFLTKEELDDIPVGSRRSITKGFQVQRLNKV